MLKNNNVIVSESKIGTFRQWIFKSGNKILARISFPCEAFHTSKFGVSFGGFRSDVDTLEAAAQKAEKWIRERYYFNPLTGQASPFTIKDKKGYPLELLVTFEDELLQDVAI